MIADQHFGRIADPPSGPIADSWRSDHHSGPAGGPQSVHLQALVPQVAGDRQSPFGVRRHLEPQFRGERVRIALRQDQRQSLAAPVAELDS